MVGSLAEIFDLQMADIPPPLGLACGLDCSIEAPCHDDLRPRPLRVLCNGRGVG